MTAARTLESAPVVAGAVRLNPSQHHACATTGTGGTHDGVRLRRDRLVGFHNAPHTHVPNLELRLGRSTSWVNHPQTLVDTGHAPKDTRPRFDFGATPTRAKNAPTRERNRTEERREEKDNEMFETKQASRHKLKRSD